MSITENWGILSATSRMSFLFGPTNAKIELLNLLRADHQFEKIKLETKDSDKMTQNEQHAFVRDYLTGCDRVGHGRMVNCNLKSNRGFQHRPIEFPAV